MIAVHTTPKKNVGKRLLVFAIARMGRSVRAEKNPLTAQGAEYKEAERLATLSIPDCDPELRARTMVPRVRCWVK
ncbi:unnamed protein product, partial [Iphiclides podalirius]